MTQTTITPWRSFARLRQSARVQPLAVKAMERTIGKHHYRWEITVNGDGPACRVFKADGRVWRATPLEPHLVSGVRTLEEAFRTGYRTSTNVRVDGEVPVTECRHNWSEMDTGAGFFGCLKCGWTIPKDEYDQMAAWRDVKNKITDGRRRLEESTRRELLDVIDMLFAAGIIKPEAIPTKRSQLPDGIAGDELFRQIERHRDLLIKFAERKKQ